MAPEVIMKGVFKKYCTSTAMDETDDILWNDSEQDGNAGSERKMKALTVKVETVTQTGTGT